MRLRKKCKETCDSLHANESLPFGCWFFQFKFSRYARLKRCDLLLAPSFPSTLYDIVPMNDTSYMFRTCLQREYALKGLAHADLAKKRRFFCMNFYCFMCDYYVDMNFCFGPVEIRQFKNNCSGLKIDWGSPPRVQLFTECVLRHYILLFYTRFCRLGLQTIDNGVVSGTDVICSGLIICPAT